MGWPRSTPWSRCRPRSSRACRRESSVLERRRGELGAVNPLAKQELEEQRERLDDVRTQVDDLAAAMRELERVIRSLTREIRERFETTFAQVQEGFDEVVGTLFPGGRGRCVLTDPEPAEPSEEGESGETRRRPRTSRRSRASSSRSSPPASAWLPWGCSRAASARSGRWRSCSR